MLLFRCRPNYLLHPVRLKRSLTSVFISEKLIQAQQFREPDSGLYGERGRRRCTNFSAIMVNDAGFAAYNGQIVKVLTVGATAWSFTMHMDHLSVTSLTFWNMTPINSVLPIGACAQRVRKIWDMQRHVTFTKPLYVVALWSVLARQNAVSRCTKIWWL